MDGVRAWQAQHRPSLRRFVHEKLLNRLSRPGRVAGVLSALANSGLPALARKLPAASVSAGARLLPDGLTTAPLPDFSAPSVPIAGHVALFTGCISRYLETPAHAAAIRVLSRFGYAVSVPNESQCCGAMHRHEGYPGTADRLRTASAELFDDARFDVVLGLASACTAELANASTLRGRVRDLTRFLANVTWPDDLEFEHSPLRVAVHTPCSQLNALKDGDAAFDLLSRLPGLVVTALPDNATCCGAAGAFVLRESTLANDLVKAKTAQLKPPLPQLLVTTNTGCALHLAARLREQGMAIPVCHAVQVLDRRMRETRP